MNAHAPEGMREAGALSLSEKANPVTPAAADLRRVYGPHAAKKIARRFGVAVVTAKLWLAGRTPAARHEEFRQELLAQADELEALVADIRRRWEQKEVADGTDGGTRRRGEASRPNASVAGGSTDRNGPVVR